MAALHTDRKFVILGGGIAGLTTAIALKRMGIEARVFEAANEFTPVGSGIVLAVNALNAYRQIGLFDAICEAGHPIHQMSIYDHKGSVISRTQMENLGKGLINLSIHRADLHRVLLSQLEKSSISSGKKSRAILPSANGYEIVFEDESTERADCIIVAEGIHAVARKQLLPQSTERYSGYTCWRGIVKAEGFHLSEASETWGINGRFGMVPLGGDRIYWFAVKNATQDSQEMRLMTTEGLLHMFRHYHKPIPSVILSTPEDQIIWNDIFDLKPIKQYALGNIVLIGDAAHATTPNMGQGACQAVEDAVVLSQCLKEHALPSDAFSSFEKKRLKRTHFIVNQSWKIGRMAQMESKLPIKLRNFFLRSIPDPVMYRQLEKVYQL